MPVKPLTLMGEGMLVTVGALMPGGVLPPERDKERVSFNNVCHQGGTVKMYLAGRNVK